MSNVTVVQGGKRSLKSRAAKVIPGGMYGHQKADQIASGFPQFIHTANGAIIEDTDGHEYVDFLLGYGPMVLGYHHPVVEEATARQRKLLDMSNGPTARMVDLAEKLVDMVDHADWAFFAKNGSDGATTALTIARAATGRAKVLVERGSYHGAATWSTPVTTGIVHEDRANIVYFDYNDEVSLRAAFKLAGDDLAAVIVTPFKHNDGGFDQQLIDPAFARALRDGCDAKNSALILDDVRCVMRLNEGSSWAHLDVSPDLTVWGKAMSNGYAISAVLGTDALRDAATSIFSTGTFWYGGVSMAAAIATIDELIRIGGTQLQERAGDRFRDGLLAQAQTHGFRVNYSGPSQMPYMRFLDGAHAELNLQFSKLALDNGVYLHPKHNWFVSTAHTDAVVDRALEGTAKAFTGLAKLT